MKSLIKTAFVTGGADGLGKAFTQALLKKGIKVCFADIQVPKGKATEVELKSLHGDDNVFFRSCDVTSLDSLKESFKAAVHQFGNVDLMVNNAGIADESNLKRLIDVNLIAVINGSELAMDHMRKDRGGVGGRIINVASTAGLTGIFVSPYYCASKFGVVGYHHSMAGNPYNSEMGLQFGCLCPAFTDTNIMKSFDPEKIKYYEEAMAIIQSVGINKVEKVVEGFMHFVDLDDCHGDIVTVTAQNGVDVRGKAKRKQKSLL